MIKKQKTKDEILYLAVRSMARPNPEPFSFRKKVRNIRLATEFFESIKKPVKPKTKEAK